MARHQQGSDGDAATTRTIGPIDDDQGGQEQGRNEIINATLLLSLFFCRCGREILVGFAAKEIKAKDTRVRWELVAAAVLALVKLRSSVLVQKRDDLQSAAMANHAMRATTTR